MKLSRTRLLAALLMGAVSVADAQLQLLSYPQPQRLFGNATQTVNTCWHNAGNESTSMEIRARLLQSSSATVVPVGEAAWKKLQMLPQQTVLESATLDFPAVKAETKFLVQWVEHTNHVIGTTTVWVYPTNLLAELKPLLVDESVGVLDPNHELKPMLKQNDVKFLDLGEMALEDFSGRLAIIGPFQSRIHIRSGLEQAIRQIAQKGVAVVWIQPPSGPKDEVKPSFYIVPKGKGAVVVVQPELVKNFSENPQSQLNLIHFCKLALHPVPSTLPDLSPP